MVDAPDGWCVVVSSDIAEEKGISSSATLRALRIQALPFRSKRLKRWSPKRRTPEVAKKEAPQKEEEEKAITNQNHKLKVTKVIIK